MKNCNKTPILPNLWNWSLSIKNVVFSCFLLFAFILNNLQIQAQPNIINPTLSPYINPIAGIATPSTISTVSHLSSYHLQETDFFPSDDPNQRMNGSLYVWTWGSINIVPSATFGCGIGWKFQDGSSSFMLHGNMGTKKLMYDPEIALLQSGKKTYIILAYYRSIDYGAPGPEGFYYDIYEWSTTGPLPLSLDNPLSSSINQPYQRISIDAIGKDKAVITWKGDMNRIYVKGIESNSTGGLTIGNDKWVINSETYIAPDVAMTYNTTNNETRTYLLLLGSMSGIESIPTIVYNDFGTIMAPGTNISFLWEYSGPPTYSVFTQGMQGNIHQLDCPDKDTVFKWSYTYNDFLDGVPVESSPKAIYSNNGTIMNLDLDELQFDPYHPRTMSMALTFDNNNSTVHYAYGIISDLPNFNFNIYLGVDYDGAGTKIGAPADFLLINPIGYFNYNGVYCVTMSKNNEYSMEAFTSCAAKEPFPAPIFNDVIHKHRKYTYGTFKSVQNKPDFIQFDLYPNPSTILPKLNAKGLNSNQELTLQIIDVLGRILYSFKGTLKEINTDLNENHSLPLGQYQFIIQWQDDNNVNHKQNLKFTKI